MWKSLYFESVYGSSVYWPNNMIIDRWTLLAYAAPHMYMMQMHRCIKLERSRPYRDQKSRLLTAKQERLAMDGWIDQSINHHKTSRTWTCAYQSPVAYQSRTDTSGFATINVKYRHTVVLVCIINHELTHYPECVIVFNLFLGGK